MLFNSLNFLYFFPVALALYFLTPQRLRWVTLVATSFFFYMCWNPKYIILLIISIVSNYFAGKLIEDAKTHSAKKVPLVVNMLFNILLLCLFKYLNFFDDNIRAIFEFIHVPYPVPEETLFSVIKMTKPLMIKNKSTPVMPKLKPKLASGFSIV